MARSYRHVKAMAEKVFELKEQGLSNREISEQFGLNLKQLKNLINRHNRTAKLKEAGVLPVRRGRPPKNRKLTEDEKNDEIKRLKIENDLLRDFLHAVGRK